MNLTSSDNAYSKLSHERIQTHDRARNISDIASTSDSAMPSRMRSISRKISETRKSLIHDSKLFGSRSFSTNSRAHKSASNAYSKLSRERTYDRAGDISDIAS